MHSRDLQLLEFKLLLRYKAIPGRQGAIPVKLAELFLVSVNNHLLRGTVQSSAGCINILLLTSASCLERLTPIMLTLLTCEQT